MMTTKKSIGALGERQLMSRNSYQDQAGLVGTLISNQRATTLSVHISRQTCNDQPTDPFHTVSNFSGQRNGATGASRDAFGFPQVHHIKHLADRGNTRCRDPGTRCDQLREATDLFVASMPYESSPMIPIGNE